MDSGEQESDEATEELESIQAIFPELKLDGDNPRSANLNLEVALSAPVTLSFYPDFDLDPVQQLRISDHITTDSANRNSDQPRTTVAEERTHTFSCLPPLHIRIDLPAGYPDTLPPRFILTPAYNWLPRSKVQELERYAKELWDEYGHSQTVYGYIDYLQSQSEAGFGLKQDGLALPSDLKWRLIEYDKSAKKRQFDSQTFDCGVCLYPKKGSVCYQMRGCGHVFCLECLQDFYNSMITEGSVETVSCLDPTCAKDAGKNRPRTLHPTELLDILIPREQVQRYVDLKLKKMLDKDKTSIFCPREWCRAPARSGKYQKYDTTDLENWPEDIDVPEDAGAEKQEQARPVNTNLTTKKVNADTDRLAICSKCQYAFCHVCEKSWHGDFVICIPKDVQSIAKEDKASFDFIRLHTSPCPTCAAPTVKIEGCNHMICSRCDTHFCYLCSAWLSMKGYNVYEHWNTKGHPCYQRLFDLSEGDEGARLGHGMFGGARAAEWQAMEFAAQFEPQDNGADNGEEANQEAVQI